MVSAADLAGYGDLFGISASINEDTLSSCGCGAQRVYCFLDLWILELRHSQTFRVVIIRLSKSTRANCDGAGWGVVRLAAKTALTKELRVRKKRMMTKV